MIKREDFDILGVLEANFKGQNDKVDVEIEGYTIVWDNGREDNQRKNSRTVAYIRNGIHFKLRNDLMPSDSPEIWLELGENREKKLLTGILYREFRPWNGDMMLASLKNQEIRLDKWLERVDKLIKKGKNLCLVGDFNLDLRRKSDTSYDRRVMANLLYENTVGKGLAQLIKEDTNAHKGSKSIVDMIFVNGVEKVVDSGVVPTGSEHGAVWVEIAKKVVKQSTITRRRTWKKFDRDKFNKDAEEINWNYDGEESNDEEGLEDRVKNLETKINDILEKHAPMKVVKEDETKALWLTTELKSRIKARNILRDKLDKRGGTNEDWSGWKRFRNKLNKDLKNARLDYLKKGLSNNMENSKTMWDGVKRYLHWDRKGGPDTLVDKGEVLRKPEERAEAISNALSDKLKLVKDKLGQFSGNYLKHLRALTKGRCRKFNFVEVTRENVLAQIRYVQNKPSTGQDMISYKDLKLLDVYIAEPLKDIINLSLRLRRFPSRWKKTIIKPTFKGGKGKLKTDPSAYRPLSLLSCLSRIMEGLLGFQMNEYAEENEIIDPSIHGYRRGLSTTTALVEIQIRLTKALEKGKISSLCLVDVSAGFDTVNHIFLLRKLELLGYGDEAIELLHDYLSGRTSVVEVETEHSKPTAIDIGFPQGGPMSPILFREYTLDLPRSLSAVEDEIEEGQRQDTDPDRSVEDSYLTKYLKNKNDVELTDGGKWELQLIRDENFVSDWREERTGIGPEHLGDGKKSEEELNSSIYADDTSAGTEDVDVRQLEENTEKMLVRLFCHMKSNRLQVNEDKTIVLAIATPQKRSKNAIALNLNINGNILKDEEWARLLGIIFSNDFSWRLQVDKVLEECSDKLGGLYKVINCTSEEDRKKLAESVIRSKLRFAIEVVSAGADKQVDRLERMQSKTARWVLKRGRIGWSRSQGYKELNWLTIPQMAAEASLRLFFKTLWNKKPSKVLREIVDDGSGEIKTLTDEGINSLTKISRRSWLIRCLRWFQVAPDVLRRIDPDTTQFRSTLRSWVEIKIEPNGDGIFKGRKICKGDWLEKELERWKSRCEEEENIAVIDDQLHDDGGEEDTSED